MTEVTNLEDEYCAVETSQTTEGFVQRQCMPRVPPSAGIYNLALSVFPFKIDTSSPRKVNARCPAKSIFMQTTLS